LRKFAILDLCSVSRAADVVAPRCPGLSQACPLFDFSTGLRARVAALQAGATVSWEAVSWANKQKLKKSFEQIVLLVLANCADPNGEAFAKWPGREHWWVYLSERTRLPKSSLFRHLNTLVALGLGNRSEQVLADGARRPTFKLNMDATFDIDRPEDAERYDAVFAKGSAENQSPVETGDDEAFAGAENDSDISHSQGPETARPPQSLVETEKSPVETGGEGASPGAGTDPFPVLGLHKDSNLVPKDSPLPPSGGPSAPEADWEEFLKSWRRPIERPSVAKAVFDRIETARRGEAITAAKGYFVWISQQRKEPAIVSAQTFLREATGWPQWLRYAPDADGAVPSVTTTYPLASPEGRAICVLYDVAGKLDFLRSVKIRNGAVYWPHPILPKLAALAQAGPRSTWVPATRQQAASWEEFIREFLSVTRSRLREGDMVPFPWRPNKDGSLPPAERPPPGTPDQLMTDQDFSDFK
jgi:hypothetical protein